MNKGCNSKEKSTHARSLMLRYAKYLLVDEIGSVSFLNGVQVSNLLIWKYRYHEGGTAVEKSRTSETVRTPKMASFVSPPAQHIARLLRGWGGGGLVRKIPDHQLQNFHVLKFVKALPEGEIFVFLINQNTRYTSAIFLDSVCQQRRKPPPPPRPDSRQSHS